MPETTSFARAVYTEGISTENFAYSLSDAQIDAIKSISSEAKQTYQCDTQEVGVAYDLRGWDNVLYDVYPACWDPGNAGPATGSGTDTSFQKIPYRSWLPEDCGDPTERCQHNVGDALFK